MAEGSIMTAPVTGPTGRTDPTSSFDTWLLQKLRLEWSSCEFGGLLTPSKLAEARASFSHLETPIKVRLLLSLLSVRQDEVDVTGITAQKEANALLLLAEQDAEEWVKVSAGIVKQFLVLQAVGRPVDSYLHAQLEATASKVVQTIATSSQTRRSSKSSMHVALDDFFSLENGLLNPSLRPALTLTAATHFTVNGEDDDDNDKEDEVGASPVKKPLHRPQMARPLGSSGAMTASAAGATTPVSMRLTQQTTKPFAEKKNMAKLSSEIRRKADAGRFKRQRSRISMIDINEVKQIKSEKAQKAEERKKQKLAAKEREKAKEKEKEKEKIDAIAAGVAADVDAKSGAADAIATSASVNDEHAAIAADIFAMHQQAGLDDPVQQYAQHQMQVEGSVEHAEVTPVAGVEGDYIPDGTQALLNAAFHSTQDIMKEVVSQQNQHMQGQHQMQHQQLQQPPYQDLYRAQQQMQMHHLAPQQQYHQGFEPEGASITNANTGGIPMGFGGYNYGTAAGYFGDQFGNYGAPQDTNAFSSAGYPTSAMGQPDNGMNGIGLPSLGGRQLGFDPTSQQQQQQHQHQQHQYQQQNNGGYMGGSGEFWR
ncbi:hypothetical protein DD237_000671 [Peronospora effusa]|uniref:HDAg domain-containing protein n=1 Tax=Peronospora effusa TaxID=542832 RepID=A0A425CKX4_9STRA|nr:hypothetical protein DD237_000671 [Peronospora effusa]